MTYRTTQHPPHYYTIRSIVRFIFWGGISTLVIWVALIGMAQANDYNPCPIQFQSDFTYTTSDWYPSMDCDLPENVELDLRGNWWWAS